MEYKYINKVLMPNIFVQRDVEDCIQANSKQHRVHYRHDLTTVSLRYSCTNGSFFCNTIGLCNFRHGRLMYTINLKASDFKSLTYNELESFSLSGVDLL